HGGVEDVDQVGHAQPQPVAGPAQRVAGDGVAAVGGVHHGAHRIPADPPGGDLPGPRQQGVLADLGLQAAPRAAAAAPPAGVDHHVPDLAAVAVGPAQQPAADDDAAADSHVPVQVDQVVAADPDAAAVLGQRPQ